MRSYSISLLTHAIKKHAASKCSHLQPGWKKTAMASALLAIYCPAQSMADNASLDRSQAQKVSSHLPTAISESFEKHKNVSQKNTHEHRTMFSEITVTATRIKQSVNDVSKNVSVINSKQINQHLTQNLNQLVQFDPGVTTSGTGRFGIQNINIRGISGNRIGMEVDGMPVPQDFSSGPFMKAGRNYVDLGSLQSVEIIKGAASTLHSSDAMGGNVAFISKSPDDYLKNGKNDYASISSAYASATSALSSTLTAAKRIQGFSGLFLYTHRNGHEQSTFGGPGGTGISRGKANPQDVYSDDVLLNLKQKVGTHHTFGLILENYHYNANTNVLSKVNNPPSSGLVYQKYQGQDVTARQQVVLSDDWKANLNAFDQLKWSLGWQKAEQNQKTFLDSTANSTPQQRSKLSNYQTQTWALNAVFNKNGYFADMGHQLVYGLAVTDINFNPKQSGYSTNLNTHTTTFDYAKMAPKASQLKAGAFIQDEMSLLDDTLQITPGIRYDYYKTKPDDSTYFARKGITNTASSVSGSHTSLNLGLLYKLTDTTRIFAQYSEGYRVPTVYEMYQSLNHLEYHYEVIPNPDLKPETSRNFEVGFRQSLASLNYQLSAFYNTYDGFIGTVTKEQGANTIFQYQNLNSAKIQGLEFSGEMDLSQWLAIAKGFSLKASAAWAEGTYKNPTKGTEPLNSVAPLTTAWGLTYNNATKTMGGELDWILVAGKNKKDIDYISTSEQSNGSPQFATPGYGVLNVTAYYKPIKNLTLRAGIFNLTNKKYWQWNNLIGIGSTSPQLDRYTQPGRNVSISATYVF